MAPLDIVVDVGGVYSDEHRRYDHHQRGFSEVFGHGGFDKTKLSSAGLVYKCARVTRGCATLTAGTLAKRSLRTAWACQSRTRMSSCCGCSCTRR